MISDSAAWRVRVYGVVLGPVLVGESVVLVRRYSALADRSRAIRAIRFAA
jgi:hypothetical protein